MCHSTSAENAREKESSFSRKIISTFIEHVLFITSHNFASTSLSAAVSHSFFSLMHSRFTFFCFALSLYFTHSLDVLISLSFFDFKCSLDITVFSLLALGILILVMLYYHKLHIYFCGKKNPITCDSMR